MNKAFTLIELLVVVAIMGLLGTASVGGYRQMQRGMEERGVVDTASKFIALASERAQIDRQPTAVYCWNELLREETDDAPPIVVGRAVAVRAKGRISAKRNSYLIDEFGDLEQFDEDGAFADVTSGNGEFLTKRLYLMDDLGNGDLKYSIVHDAPEKAEQDGVSEIYLSSAPQNDNAPGASKGKIIRYGYAVESGGTASMSNWKIGSRYGMEFQSIELPHNYIFGSKVPSSMSTPVAYVATLCFDAEFGNANGGSVGSATTVSISSLRPGPGGALAPQDVGTTEKPNAKLR